MAEPIDVALVRDQLGNYDIAIGPSGDFELSPGMDSIIAMSLLTDGRADASEVVDPLRRRGWVGDLYLDEQQASSGSKLWLFEQERRTNTTLNGILAEVDNALSFMVTQGLLSAVTPSIVPRGVSGAALRVVVTAVDGATEQLFFDLWANTGAE